MKLTFSFPANSRRQCASAPCLQGCGIRLSRLVLLCAALCAFAGADADCVPARPRTSEQQAKVSAWENGGRAEVLKWFGEHQFGVTPIGRPADEVIGERSVTFANGTITIDIHLSLPKGASKEHPVPVFIFGDHMGGREKTPPFTKMEYVGIPTNTITSRGYAYVRWNFNDVCPNATKNSSADLDAYWAYGIVAYNATGDKASCNVKRTPTSWGTLGAWAWGFGRVMDWVETRPELDAKRVAVIGHSRGGKTALWAAAQDTRFAMGISNNSGCGGAKLNNFDCPKSEHIGQVLRTCPNWFCLNYQEWIDRDAEITRDSDDLLRLIAPRICYVASATADRWCGPSAEKEAWTRAHDLWEAYGCPERMGYHIREGKHQLTEYDWNKYMDFADKYMK